MHVLVIDDDHSLLRALDIGLRANGMTVSAADTGHTALRAFTNDVPDLVLLDLGLPAPSGMEVLSSLRQWSQVPVIVLSARHETRQKIAALDAGADDYLTKPFGIDELLARMRAVLRRQAPSAPGGVIAVGPLTIDLTRSHVERDGQRVHLTPREWAVLATLARADGRLVTQQELIQAVWGPNAFTDTDNVRAVVARLRRKLEPGPGAPAYLVTEPGIGYRLEREQ